VEGICASIIAFKPDIVITEKGVSDLAQHYFLKAGITAFRRLRKTDCNRVARAVGATIVNRPDEIQESDIGTNCGLFEVRKIGDEYVFCYTMFFLPSLVCDGLFVSLIHLLLHVCIL
jgi:T-complex protein 1 subunit gamma